MQNRTRSIPQKSPERKLKLNPHSCASPNQSPFLPPSSHRTPARYNALYTLHLTTTAKAPRVAALSHSRACDKDYTLSPQASSRGRPAVRESGRLNWKRMRTDGDRSRARARTLYARLLRALPIYTMLLLPTTVAFCEEKPRERFFDWPTTSISATEICALLTPIRDNVSAARELVLHSLSLSRSLSLSLARAWATMRTA